MKKFFKYLGISLLLSISFFYTEKTANVVKELDEIMIEIRKLAETHKIEPIEAEINNNTIIPGLNGSEIDVEKSYREMRYIGNFNEKYLQYRKIYIKNKLKDNLDKYIISGNKARKDVSILFVVENNTSVNEIIQILNKNNISATFLISGLWLEKNNNQVYQIINDNHNLGSIGYNYSYKDSSYAWLDNVIKRITKENHSYCIKVDEENLNICAKYKNYTLATDIIDENPLSNVKSSLSNGSILIFKINDELITELELIIKYINSKNLNIVNINKLLQE